MRSYEITAESADSLTITAQCVNCGVPVVFTETRSIIGDDMLRNALLNWLCCTRCLDIQKNEIANQRHQENELEKHFRITESYNLRRKESRIDDYLLGFDINDPRANLELYNWAAYRQSCCQLLTGETGQCKTRILQHFALEKLSGGATVFYSPVIDLLDEIAAMGKYPDRCRIFVHKIMKYDLLILEDFGKEALTESKKSRLWQIIERRSVRFIQEQNIAEGRFIPSYVQAGRKDGWQLWMTTNLSCEDIYCRFEEYGHTKSGDPLNRRLLEMCQVWTPSDGGRNTANRGSSGE